MPITSEKIFICAKCGKKFTMKIGDNIKGNDVNKILYCKKCRK